jgi:hypothetical protein
VLAQFVKDLFHLERRPDRLDQDRGPDGAPRNAELLLCVNKDVVPQPGLEVTFHLRQIEVRALSGIELSLGAVKEIKTEVEEAA